MAHRWGSGWPALMAVNGDEGEPGTFKDRLYLSGDPHRMIEGILIAAHVVDVDACYIYMRDEYPEIIALLRREIALSKQRVGRSRATASAARRWCLYLW